MESSKEENSIGQIMGNSKLVYIVGMAIVVFLLHYNYEAFEKLKELGNTERRKILAFQQVMSEKLDIKEGEIKNKELQIAKYDANIQAFNGTDCMRCHVVETHLQLPMNASLPDFNEFRSKVRNGSNLMPAYKGTTGKTRNEITDSELRRQYRILEQFFKKYY